MRELKCRAKRIDNGEWVYGSYVFQEGWHYIVVVEYLGDGCSDCGCPCVEWHLVDAETVGQYTGLKDKDGKEIYEGDIVRHGLFKQDYKMIVRYREESAALMFGDKRTGFSFSSDQIKYLEVIGNIHENPELLEVQP